MRLCGVYTLRSLVVKAIICRLQNHHVLIPTSSLNNNFYTIDYYVEEIKARVGRLSVSIFLEI
jgi:hypothetical protein